MNPATLCAQALVKIGAQPIQSLQDASYEAQVAHVLYAGIRDRLLGAARWSFAARRAVLNPLAPDPSDTPNCCYYPLPTGFLRVLSLRNASGYSLADFQVLGSRLEIRTQTKTAQDSAVTLWFAARVAENAMPPYFQNILVCALAAEFAVPLAGSTALADRFLQETERLIVQARQLERHHNTKVRTSRQTATLLQVR